MSLQKTVTPLARSYAVELKGPRQFSDGKTMHYARTEKLITLNGLQLVNDYYTWALNPGLLTPELATVSAQYDYYVFNKLVVKYVPELAITHAGNLYMCHEPDPNDGTVPTSEKMMVMPFSKTKPLRDIQTLSLHIDKRRRRVRCGGVAGDTSTFDAGFLFARVEGLQHTGPVGSLFIDYEVTFSKNSPVGVIPRPQAAICGNIVPAVDLKIRDPGEAFSTAFFDVIVDSVTPFRSNTTAQPINIQSFQIPCGAYKIDYCYSLTVNNLLGASADIYKFAIRVNAVDQGHQLQHVQLNTLTNWVISGTTYFIVPVASQPLTFRCTWQIDGVESTNSIYTDTGGRFIVTPI